MAGGRVFDASLDALAPFGRLVTYGIASREPNQVSTGALMRKSRAVVGFWLMHCLQRPAELVDAPLQELFERAAAGELSVVEGETYALSEVRRAHEDLRARRTDRQAAARPDPMKLPEPLRRRVDPRLDAFAVRRYRALSARSPRDRELDRATLRAFDQVVADAVDHGRRNRMLDRTVARAFRALADADLAGDRPSRPIRRALVAQFHRLYYHSHERTWQSTRFLGVDVWKTRSTSGSTRS